MSKQPLPKQKNPERKRVNPKPQKSSGAEIEAPQIFVHRPIRMEAVNRDDLPAGADEGGLPDGRELRKSKTSHKDAKYTKAQKRDNKAF